MTELVITRGIPGSGKSTFAEAWVRAGDNRVRVNRDDIRKMCFGVDFGCDEQFVSRVETAMVLEALTSNKSVIVDATHIRPSYIARWRKMAEDMDATFVLKEFFVPLYVALERNANRERKVPEKVIRDMFASLERWAID